MRDQIARKFWYGVLMLVFAYAYTVAFLYSLVRARRSRPDRVRRIAAVWYNPRDLTGSNLRLGHWKQYFEEIGVRYDNYWAYDMKEYREQFERAPNAVRYRFYSRLVLRRLRQFLRLREYDVVWIARGFLPLYPLKYAFFERCLRRMGMYLVVDSTDGGDMLGNERLVLDTMAQADRITVAFRFLREFFEKRFPDVVHVEWTIPQDPYTVKSDYAFTGLPTIGWMGSPGNYRHLEKLEGELTKVARMRPFRFLYICRQNMGLQIEGAVVEHRFFEDDYYRILAEFDIGLCPYLQTDLRTQGKIGMKHQEFLLCGIPQVCSPVAISEYVETERHALIAHDVSDWADAILRLLESEALRAQLGRESRRLFLDRYTYEGELETLHRALTEFPDALGNGAGPIDAGQAVVASR